MVHIQWKQSPDGVSVNNRKPSESNFSKERVEEVLCLYRLTCAAVTPRHKPIFTIGGALPPSALKKNRPSGTLSKAVYVHLLGAKFCGLSH